MKLMFYAFIWKPDTEHTISEENKTISWAYFKNTFE